MAVKLVPAPHFSGLWLLYFTLWQLLMLQQKLRNVLENILDKFC